MAARNQSVTVMDCRCGRHDMGGKDFKIKLATNFIDYHMDEYVSEAAVAAMIKNGIRVSVVPFK
jgi:hypothetical protein